MYSLQCLHIGAEARDAHECVVVDLEDALEVCVDGHELRGETGICGDGDAVLASHGNHHVTVVVKDRLKLRRS